MLSGNRYHCQRAAPVCKYGQACNPRSGVCRIYTEKAEMAWKWRKEQPALWNHKIGTKGLLRRSGELWYGSLWPVQGTFHFKGKNREKKIQLAIWNINIFLEKTKNWSIIRWIMWGIHKVVVSTWRYRKCREALYFKEFEIQCFCVSIGDSRSMRKIVIWCGEWSSGRFVWYNKEC